MAPSKLKVRTLDVRTSYFENEKAFYVNFCRNQSIPRILFINRLSCLEILY